MERLRSRRLDGNHSLRGAAAGGGTRMRKGLDMNEVLSLAKTMEVKFTVSGPAIGGAKFGINFDPRDPRKKGVLQRWYKAVTPLLKHYYGTGGDLNVDEIHDVIPITESCGVWHPQEGIFNVHFKPSEADKINRIGQLRLEVISPGANVPFADKEIFFGPIMEYTDHKISLLPDFISNCGIARVFAKSTPKKSKKN